MSSENNDGIDRINTGGNSNSGTANRGGPKAPTDGGTDVTPRRSKIHTSTTNNGATEPLGGSKDEYDRRTVLAALGVTGATATGGGIWWTERETGVISDFVSSLFGNGGSDTGTGEGKGQTPPGAGKETNDGGENGVEAPGTYELEIIDTTGRFEDNPAITSEPSDEEFRQYDIDFQSIDEINQERLETVFQETERDWQEFIDTLNQQGVYEDARQTFLTGYPHHGLSSRDDQYEEFKPQEFLSEDSLIGHLDWLQPYAHSWHIKGPEGEEPGDIGEALNKAWDNWIFSPVMQRGINQHTTTQSFLWPVEISSEEIPAQEDRYFEGETDTTYHLMLAWDATNQETVIADTSFTPQWYRDQRGLRPDEEVAGVDEFPHQRLHQIRNAVELDYDGTLTLGARSIFEDDGTRFDRRLRAIHDTSENSLFLPEHGKTDEDLETYLEEMEEQRHEDCERRYGASEERLEECMEDDSWMDEKVPDFHDTMPAREKYLPFRLDVEDPEPDWIDSEEALVSLADNFRRMAAAPEYEDIENQLGEDAKVDIDTEYLLSVRDEFLNPGTQLGDSSLQYMTQQAQILHELAEDNEGVYRISGTVREPVYEVLEGEAEIDRAWR